MGCIGTGDRWGAVGGHAIPFADIVAVCDVDQRRVHSARDHIKSVQGKQPDAYEDYRKVLEREDIDVVTVVTTDHWHTKIAVEAMRAGKDVYCEKPLTLTIDEGKLISKVQKETGRVFQVGTQQRSEMGRRFLHAIAMIRDGRIGRVKEVTCNIGGAPTSKVIPVAEVPQELNWDMWLGQAPYQDYRYMEQKSGDKIRRFSRGHFEFRWWYEYSGGIMTDWGAHHVDIATWATGMEATGPIKITPIEATHPVPLDKNGMPTRNDQYNCATQFRIRNEFDSGLILNIVSNSPDGNGILFEGTEGRFHVSRGRMKGAPVEELENNPILDDQIAAVYGGKLPPADHAHMANFFDCVRSRALPISDVHSHHRALTTCHLANIAIRLDRELQWDPKAEQIVGDNQARQMQGRQQRKGYEIES
ncbi:MAG: Gfo/Idh/MocA family oxidoreductase [Planctomycetaceae bacterium]